MYCHDIVVYLLEVGLHLHNILFIVELFCLKEAFMELVLVYISDMRKYLLFYGNLGRGMCRS